LLFYRIPPSHAHTTEPELFRGYDPKKKVFNQEIELIHDLEAIEVAESEAHKFKLQHGDKCDVWAGEGGQWFFKLKKGALVFVPKSFSFSRTVAGQIPTGWHAGRYGIPDDIIAQADRATLWALVCTAEALNMSGITDPYELYKHIHPSEVGTSLGSGMGGTVSMAKMFKDRRDEKDVQNDILQETYVVILFVHIKHLRFSLVSSTPRRAGSTCFLCRRVVL
jgi:fatty acid synthase subunit beta